MKFLRSIVWATAAGCVLTLPACETTEPAPLDYGVRQVRTADSAVLLDAAEAALVEQGYTIGKRDVTTAVMTTEPIENDPRDRGARSGVGLSSPAKTRRIVEVRVGTAAGETKVYCKVLVQEQASQAYGMYASERSGSDLPGSQTAIDRDAATTKEQNTVWRTIRRDTAGERQILEAILSRTGDDAGPAPNPTGR